MAKRLYEERSFLLYNSLTHKREELKPLEPPKVLYYSCGPTVYGPLHIGNARALIFSDLLYRWLKHLGYNVNYVRNYTDVDDKIIDRAQEEKLSSSELSEKYIQYCEDDMRALGLLSPVKTVRVTESMNEIFEMIQKLIEKGHAYVVGEEVFYSVRSFKDYGKLSRKDLNSLQAGARVEVDSRKKDPFDFSLWKPCKPGEPFWESPWGKGRPGWHIECSAMAVRWLGETIDLHHGGQDLIFPHHENEIAQSEGAHKKIFCKHWVHHAFLTSGNEKMSKSLGNILTIREFNEKYGAELLKFIYFSFHYRSAVPYTEEMLSQALGELERIYLAKQWAEQVLKAAEKSSAAAEPWKALLGKAQTTFLLIEKELASDLNTPGALGHLLSFVRDLNHAETQGAGKPGVKALVGGKPGEEARSSLERHQVAAEFLELLEDKLSLLCNLFGEEPETVLKKIESIRHVKAQSVSGLSDSQISTFIAERAQARKDKDFKRADEIRKNLESQGIILIDHPSGLTTWRAK